MKARVALTHWEGVFKSEQDGKPMPPIHHDWNWTGACRPGMKIGQLVQPRR